MTKILYNSCYGGFGLSDVAMTMYKQKAGLNPEEHTYAWDLDRADPVLIDTVEELGLKLSSGRHSKLAIAEIPSGVKYRIDEYDGYESVMTIDDYEWKVA